MPLYGRLSALTHSLFLSASNKKYDPVAAEGKRYINVKRVTGASYILVCSQSLLVFSPAEGIEKPELVDVS